MSSSVESDFKVYGIVESAILELCNGEKVDCINQRIQTDLCYKIFDQGILKFNCLDCGKMGV